MFVFVVLRKNIRSFVYTIFGDFDCFTAQFWTIVRFSIILEIMILTAYMFYPKKVKGMGIGVFVLTLLASIIEAAAFLDMIPVDVYKRQWIYNVYNKLKKPLEFLDKISRGFLAVFPTLFRIHFQV